MSRGWRRLRAYLRQLLGRPVIETVTCARCGERVLPGYILDVDARLGNMDGQPVTVPTCLYCVGLKRRAANLLYRPSEMGRR